MMLMVSSWRSLAGFIPGDGTQPLMEALGWLDAWTDGVSRQRRVDGLFLDQPGRPNGQR